MEQAGMRKDNLWKKAFRKFCRDRIGIAALGIVATYAIIAIGADQQLWATGWDEVYVEDGRVPPSAEFPFGTNNIGQDVYQRAIFSTKTATSGPTCRRSSNPPRSHRRLHLRIL